MRVNNKVLRGCAVAVLVVMTVVAGGASPAGAAARATDDSCPSGQVPPTGFTDVAPGNVHHDAIDCMVWWHVANGTGPHTYNPSGQVNRDQMASFLARVLDLLVEGGFASTASAGVHIGHVFIIELENKGFDKTWGSGSPATYLNGTLRPQGQLLTQYYGIGHASLDNYIAQISGQAPNPETQADCVTYKPFVMTGIGAYGQALGSGCVFPKSVPTIAAQLE